MRYPMSILLIVFLITSFSTLAQGEQWVLAGEWEDVVCIWDLLETSDGAIWASGSDSKTSRNLATVYRSIDGGDTWTILNRSWPINVPYARTLLETDQGIVWVGFSHSAGVYATTNLGESWTNLYASFDSTIRRILKTQGGDTYIVRASTSSDYVYVSPDNGSSWNQIPAFGGQYESIFGIAEQDGIVYASAKCGGAAGPISGCVYGTTNNDSWDVPTGVLEGSTGINVLITDTQGVLWGAGECVGTEGKGIVGCVFRKDSQADAWVRTGEMETSMEMFAISALDKGTIYAGGECYSDVYESGCVFRSSDNGVSWELVGTFPREIYALLVTSDCQVLAGDVLPGHVYRLIADDGCRIDCQSYSDGETNQDNLCEVCDSTRSFHRWSFVNDGVDCEDGFFCNGVDACLDGQCIHAGDPCKNGQTCNEELNICDESTSDDDDVSEDDDDDFADGDDDHTTGDDDDDDKSVGCV